MTVCGSGFVIWGQKFFRAVEFLRWGGHAVLLRVLFNSPASAILVPQLPEWLGLGKYEPPYKLAAWFFICV